MFGDNFPWPVALEEENFKFRHYSFAILDNGRDTSFRGLGNPLPDVPSVVKIGSVIIANEYYQFFSMYLCTFVIISCLKRE